MRRRAAGEPRALPLPLPLFPFSLAIFALAFAFALALCLLLGGSGGRGRGGGFAALALAPWGVFGVVVGGVRVRVWVRRGGGRDARAADGDEGFGSGLVGHGYEKGAVLALSRWA
jgi:hypothetical protein